MSHYRFRAKKHVPFISLPRNRQKHQYIQAKNLIRRASRVLSGVFYTYDYMHGENGWVDGYFLGKIPPIFYNFSLETARHAYMNLVLKAAMDKADELVPRENGGDWLLHLKPNQSYQIPDPPYPEFGGLTRMDWVKQQLPGMANSDDYHVVEQWSLHRDYCFGIGLHATIDVPFLTIEAVNAFVQRFLDGGESNFFSSDRLTYAHDEIAYWGVESNAILEPWEWEAVGSSEQAGADTTP